MCYVHVCVHVFCFCLYSNHMVEGNQKVGLPLVRNLPQQRKVPCCHQHITKQKEQREKSDNLPFRILKRMLPSGHTGRQGRVFFTTAFATSLCNNVIESPNCTGNQSDELISLLYNCTAADTKKTQHSWNYQEKKSA